MFKRASKRTIILAASAAFFVGAALESSRSDVQKYKQEQFIYDTEFNEIVRNERNRR